MSNFKEVLCNAIGRLHIPQELSELKGKKLLHVSDTPVCFYSGLRRLINILKPDYIIHTGDMADNIKLELYPTSICEYEKWIKRLAAMLEASGAEVVLAMGNHDDFDIAGKYFKSSRILKEAETIKVEDMSFRISHKPEGILEDPAQYNLFGHDLTLKSGCIDNKLYYNGISNINIIELDSGECTTLSYPSGTDDARLGRRKIGL
ncbi:MAG TPA: metallophosphoesterase [Clostridia bacterium]|nr:metallophosphoesterase [Clostridia bacterium]